MRRWSPTGLKRFWPLGLLIIGIALFYAFDLHEKISTDRIKEFQQEHPIFFPFIFIFFATLLSVFSLVGIVPLSLLAGYFFPLPISFFLVLFSVTCGGVILFLIAKTAFGNFLKKRGAPFFRKMEKGFTKNRAGYLLVLHLLPLFPFWSVNVAAAFFGVRLATFIWTAMVGIAPTVLIFTIIGSSV